MALAIASLALILAGAGWYLSSRAGEEVDLAPLNPFVPVEPTEKPLPLKEYAFGNLSNRVAVASSLDLDEILAEESEFKAYRFSFTTMGKKMTGQLNVPAAATPSAGFPVVFMLRGYVDKEMFTTGMGTKNAAAALAQNGYVTVAPDFLGYGGSDEEPEDSIESRIQKPAQILDLLASLKSLEFVNNEDLVLWGHSNGGQIALSMLEITGKNWPTVLWAPVTKPFPYSILYFTDESPDQGKYLRRIVAQFEADYDVFDYSIDRYFELIAAPIQLHQGGADTAVPIAWSNDFVRRMQALDKEIDYQTYPGMDHQMQPGWGSVMQRTLVFYAAERAKLSR